MTYVRRRSTARSGSRIRKVRGTRTAASAAALLLVTGGLTAWSLAPQPANAAVEQTGPVTKQADQGEDFDGDGYADLVVGAPGGTVSGKAQAGYVAVMYGSAEGLDPSRKKVVSRSTSGVPGTAVAKQRFGTSFSKGDMDGDGYADLVIGSADASADSVVLLGGAAGFTVAKGPWGDRGDMDLGDVDGDGYDDLVVSEGSDMVDEVTVTFGAKDGLSTSRVQTFDQSIEGFPGKQEESDMFGSCVSVADVTGDGRAEVALGIRWKDAAGKTDSGAVALLHGSRTGVTGSGSQLVDQDTEGVPGVAEEGDEFGTACALLDVDGDGHRDLAVSATEENESAGALWSLRGTGDGLTTKGATAFGPGDLGAPATNALFGSLLR